MQFKTVKNTVQVLRYEAYDAVKKRAIVKQVASISLHNHNTTVRQGFSLTVDEKKEIQSYIIDILQSNENHILQSDFERVDIVLKNTLTVIQDESTTVSKEKALQILKLMTDLKRELKARGFTTATKAQVTKQQEQQDLPL